MLTGGNQALDGELTMQCADDALQDCTVETCIILLTIVTPINSIQVKKRKIK